MKSYLPLLFLAGVAALLLLGIVHLFEMRFAHGDIYPPYSSLRADPLGTMALYESLGKIPDVAVQRDFSDTDRLPEAPQTVYLHLAGDSGEWGWLSADLFHNLQQYLARGNRLVIAFAPQTEGFSRDDLDEPDTNSISPVKTRSSTHKHHAKLPLPHDTEEVSLEEKWGFHPSFLGLVANDENYISVRVVNRTEPLLPPDLDWHSGIIFTNSDSAWRKIYLRGRDPVLMERTFGQGSVVLASDSYFASNEALSQDRHADLLAWLVGSNTNVVFDEAHFGIVESPGVATLMRQYRLEGLAAALIFLAGLFIWKNATSLAPTQAEDGQRSFHLGKDSTSGFVNLLRRGIAPQDLLATGFAEWKKSRASGGKCSASRLAQAEALFQQEQALAPKDRNSIQTYRQIAVILGNKKT